MPYTEDTGFHGVYRLRFRAFYVDYPDKYLELDEPFNVRILDPCQSPRSLTAPDMLLNDLVFEYTMMTPSDELTFTVFTPDPAWCDVQYSYQVNNRQGFAMVQNWDALDRTLTYEYSEDLSPLNNDAYLES